MTESDVRAWVRDENKKVLESIKESEDKRELAHAKQVAELQMRLQRADNSKQLTAENKTVLGVIALIVVAFGLALGAYLKDPSNAEECVQLCEPKGVAKWMPSSPQNHPTCECRP